MVEVVTNDKWRLPIGDYLKERCYISADIGDKFSSPLANSKSK